MENQKSLMQFLIINKILDSKPESLEILKALADWIASQAIRAPELADRVQNTAEVRNDPQIKISRETIEKSINAASRVEPKILNGIREKVTLNETELLKLL